MAQRTSECIICKSRDRDLPVYCETCLNCHMHKECFLLLLTSGTKKKFTRESVLLGCPHCRGEIEIPARLPSFHSSVFMELSDVRFLLWMCISIFCVVLALNIWIRFWDAVIIAIRCAGSKNLLGSILSASKGMLAEVAYTIIFIKAIIVAHSCVHRYRLENSSFDLDGVSDRCKCKMERKIE
jgi:hypothetical protein